MKLKKFLANYNVIIPLIILMVALVVWEGRRSNWTATWIYWVQSFKYHVLHADAVTGTYTSEIRVEWHRQEHSLSCEIASLKMALSAYGVNVQESELISRLKFDSTPRSGKTWGDPFTGFVGNIDGRMGVTGYGVYWDPIVEVAKQYKPTEVKKFNSPAELAQEISKGHPVIAWGYNGSGNKINWTTPAGKNITAINGEHARVIAGFDGDVNNPTKFIVYDPIYGKLSWTAERVFENWQPFDNMGVVVYPDNESILDQILKIE